MDESELKAIADQLSCPKGKDGIEVGNKMNELNRFITSRTIESLAPQPNEVIAEIGPGNGALSESLVARLGSKGKYYGIELSESMATEAMQRFSNSACAVDIICGDCTTAPVPEHSLDGIMAVNLLYFIDDLNKLFGRIRQWLKTDARAVFGVRSEQSLNNVPFTKYGFHIRSDDEIIESMRNNGFRDVSSTYYDEGTVPFGDLALPIDSIIISGCAQPVTTTY